LQRYSPMPELALSDCAVNTAEAGSLQSYGQFAEGFYTLDLNEAKVNWHHELSNDAVTSGLGRSVVRGAARSYLRLRDKRTSRLGRD
jgi:hypothetical protein